MLYWFGADKARRGAEGVELIMDPDYIKNILKGNV